MIRTNQNISHHSIVQGYSFRQKIVPHRNRICYQIDVRRMNMTLNHIGFLNFIFNRNNCVKKQKEKNFFRKFIANKCLSLMTSLEKRNKKKNVVYCFQYLTLSKKCLKRDNKSQDFSLVCEKKL